jgi:hypothetical protein
MANIADLSQWAKGQKKYRKASRCPDYLANTPQYLFWCWTWWLITEAVIARSNRGFLVRRKKAEVEEDFMVKMPVVDEILEE